MKRFSIDPKEAIVTDHPFPLSGWLQYTLERHAGKAPLWNFADFPPSNNLVFERLHFDNRNVVLEMFANDKSPFVDGSFKSPEKLYAYVAEHWISSPYSTKHGAADWIVRTRQDDPVGLIHVYDVSRETWALNHRRCSIGYAVAENFRGSSLAQEAVRALQDYLFSSHDMLMLLAMPDKANARSVRFLRNLGYEDRTQDYGADQRYKFFELYRDAAARQQMMDRFQLK